MTIAAEADRVRRVVTLSNPEYRLQEISSTFHGRDVFAPAAAHLSLGADTASFGEPLDKYVTLDVPTPFVRDGHLYGTVLCVDSFGNLITNVTRFDISKNFPGAPPEAIEVSIKGAYISGLVNTYSDAAPGSLVALIGSTNALEIAVNGKDAAKTLGAGTGERVTVKRSGKGPWQ